jgi:hypothetical protein
MRSGMIHSFYNLFPVLAGVRGSSRSKFIGGPNRRDTPNLVVPSPGVFDRVRDDPATRAILPPAKNYRCATRVFGVSRKDDLVQALGVVQLVSVGR